MLRYSAPLVPTYVLWWVTSASDRWFVIGMVGQSENGIYSAAYKIPTLLMMFTTLFFQAWQMSVIENKDDGELVPFFSRIWKAYSALLLVGACGLIWICKPLTDILVDTNGKGFGESYKYCAVLVIAMVFQCGCQFLTSVYNVKKKSANACFTALIAAAVNIALNFFLIPKFGVTGAAIATALSYLICFIVRMADSLRYIRFTPCVGRMIINSCLAVTSCVICYRGIPFAGVIMFGLLLVAFLINLPAVTDTIRKIRHE
jgi:O-antigen/teichoic acid export membrane protein